MRDYALHFPVVEIQNTFYEPPRDSVIKNWLSTAAPSLEYTMKVWQLVTHAASSPTYRRMKRAIDSTEEPGFFRESDSVDQGWQRSVECANLLSASAMLFQSPASFRPEPDNVRRMRTFFERIDRPRARLLWEPRGAQWAAERGLALSLCRDLNLTYVVDPFVTQPATRCSVYWRLHGIGSSRHSYTDAELTQLQQMLVDAEPAGVAYVMFTTCRASAMPNGSLALSASNRSDRRVGRRGSYVVDSKCPDRGRLVAGCRASASTLFAP
ncbi:MAG: DUF72 domain-containing protein [Burkholderiaceae bacterium]